ncbi:hypothetical protein SAMD00019534_044410 [Acytostelium subglobosum LB1]|uniref:hypothetical protein n=1 Tax=Acytostelium subglobosum LB1 TaxID=1410327 RepID=UPI000644DF53|nr:hypothetical protein SAMD00019534_044410 [Acytostelium subglobosum LB1]GAM21266.1 hypothetical protein SAMD00019534_044410 [Acytostelium subglobosum LB1]|eukprot:XP_012755385.1 hypothetical protein SAMD00019534_044410 [Acytostelium subglobosum LB1]
MKRSYRLYAAVTPSLEDLLKKELTNILKQHQQQQLQQQQQKLQQHEQQDVDLSKKKKSLPVVSTPPLALPTLTTDRGGVECADLTPEQLWSITHHSRLAETLRVRLGQPFKSTNFNMLKSGLQQLPWSNYFAVRDRTLPECSASCASSALYHSGAVEERVLEHFQKNVIFVKRMTPEMASEDSGHSRLFVRLVDDMAQISVDVCNGDGLHKRTPGKHVTDAPIRETLAAALLTATGFSSARPFNIWDPFMGSGTIIQEALGIARGGRCTPTERRYAFEQWPLHRADRYDSFLVRINEQMAINSSRLLDDLRAEKVVFYGSDIDPKAVRAAQHNLTEAGFQILPTTSNDLGSDAAPNNNNGYIRLWQGDFKDALKGINHKVNIITNMPYGSRIMSGKGAISKSLKDTFVSFGEMIRTSDKIHNVYVLNGHPMFKELSGVEWNVLLEFTNGGLPVEFLKMKR